MTHTRVCCNSFKGGPGPLENELNKILGSKREDRFSDHFSDLVQNICSVRFSYLLRLSIFCKAPRDMRKFPQKCQKIAGCWESAVYGSRPPIASKPDSSPPERAGLDDITRQPWSEATCPCTTSPNAYLRFVAIFLLEKTRQSTRSGGTGARCVRRWLTRDISWYRLDRFVPEGISQVSRPKQVRKTNLDMFLVPFQKKGWKIDHDVWYQSMKRLVAFFFKGFRSTLKCVPWLIHMCATTHSYVCHDSFIYVPWLIHVCVTTHLNAWHDSFICVTWLIPMLDMTNSYAWKFVTSESRTYDTT